MNTLTTCEFCLKEIELDQAIEHNKTNHDG